MSTPAPARTRASRDAGRSRAAAAHDAFISYSHAADGRLAQRLEEGLERLAKPLLRPRALDVFRDDTGLSATPELWPTIRRALDASRYFILMASPKAAESDWVKLEVEHWLTASPAAKEGKAAERLLIVLTGGTICWNKEAQGFEKGSTALPPRLHRGVFAHEPLWVDLCRAHTEEDLSLQNAYFRGKVADLAATLHGKSKEELIGEDVRLARRNRRLAWSASTLLAVLAVTASFAAVVAVRERDRASSRAIAAAAVARLDIDPHESLRGAVTAVERSPTPEAISALRESLIRSSLRDESKPVSGKIQRAVFSPRGDRIVAQVALPGSGGYLQTWPTSPGARGCVSAGAALLGFTADGAGMVTPGGRVIDLVTCTPIRRRTALGEMLTPSLEVASDAFEQTIRDARTDSVVLELPRTIAAVAGVERSSDGTLAITWSERREGGGPSEAGEVFARVWTLPHDGGRPPETPPGGYLLFGHRRAISAAAFGSEVIATGSHDRTVRIWSRRRSTDDWQESAVLRGHQATVTAVALSPRDDRVVSVDANGTARVWETGAMVASLSDFANIFAQLYGRPLPRMHGIRPAGDLVLTRDGRTVVANVGVLSLASVSIADGAQRSPVLDLRRYHGTSPPMLAENLSEQLNPDGSRILVPSGDGGRMQGDSVVLVVEVATGEVLDTVYGHTGPVYAAAYSPDGGRIATAGHDGTVRLWDAGTVAPRGVLRLPNTPVIHVAFSPDGGRLVLSSRDLLARVWDPRASSLVELFGHEGSVRKASFSPDGTLVVSVGDDGVRVWDARSGKMLRRYEVGGATYARLSSDCSTLLAGDWVAAQAFPFGACGPVERMMALARGRIRTVAAGARPSR